jgi:hypothetical protein
MPKTRPSVPLNDSVLSILRIGVKVSYEPTGVDAQRLLVLLVYGNVEGSNADSRPDESLQPLGDIGPQTGWPSMGRPRIMATSWSVIVASPHVRWNMWVSGRHRSTSAINAAESINGRLSVMSRASDRSLAWCMNGVYRSSHIRGLFVRVLSKFNVCNTILVNNISHICYNILTKSIKHIKHKHRHLPVSPPWWHVLDACCPNRPQAGGTEGVCLPSLCSTITKC